MESSDKKPPRHPQVVVLGAGLAGLAAVDAVVRRGGLGSREVTIVEPSGRPGGVIGTRHTDGWLVERSADCFLAARPEGLDLVARLGLEGELIGVLPEARRALIWHAGRAVPAPAGFRLLAPGRLGPVLGSPLLSLAGRLRLVGERFVPRGTGDDESLEQFAVRRLGREAFERLVQPLASGIWTADPSRLSMAAACPDFLALEREHGSLWAGERARLRRQPPAGEATGARYGQFITLASGMETLPRTLAAQLRQCGVRFAKAAATGLVRESDGRWRVETTGADGGTLRADAVVVASPAPVASRLLAGTDANLAADLAAIDYAGSCIVSLGFTRDRVSHPLDAAGMVIPRAEGRRVLAVSFSSSKFPGRAPRGCVLMRVFIGGALDPEAVRLDDAALVERALSEVEQMLGTRGEPRLAHVERWAGAMPQYHLGHVARMARIDAAVARLPGLTIAGAAYAGVGIPQVIASGRRAAEACLTTSHR
ncbi:MAG: protoporphyrinogen oxidase [Pirellulales bacterium]